MIVAMMSSLPSCGVDVIRATINPISDSVRRAAAMSRAKVCGGLTALEQKPKRLADAALEATGLGSHPLAGEQHEGVADIHEGSHGADDPLQRIHLVDPRRIQPRLGVVEGDLRQLVEQGLTVREVPIDRGSSDPGCSRDVIHVRLLPLDRE